MYQFTTPAFNWVIPNQYLEQQLFDHQSSTTKDFSDFLPEIALKLYIFLWMMILTFIFVASIISKVLKSYSVICSCSL